MTFLNRWDDDRARPTLSEAGRDLAVRVAAPMTVWWLVVLAIGWGLTDGPLKELGTREERFNKWLASGRTSVLDTITLVFSGGAALRLEVECLECELADLGPTWTAAARPAHTLDIDQA